jgi:hypothetical protein
MPAAVSSAEPRSVGGTMSSATSRSASASVREMCSCSKRRELRTAIAALAENALSVSICASVKVREPGARTTMTPSTSRPIASGTTTPARSESAPKSRWIGAVHSPPGPRNVAGRCS